MTSASRGAPMNPRTEAFIAQQTSPDTKVAYTKDIQRWESSGYPLTVEGVAAWRQELTTKHSNATAARYYPAVRPSVVVDLPSDNVVDALVASLTTPRNRLIVALLLNGLRASEVVNLKADALRFENGYGHYLVFRGKGDKERVVPVLQEVLDAINEQEGDSEWLVHDEDGSQLTYDAVNGVVDTAARKVGAKVHPHMLRHHYATRLTRAGANPFVLQKLMGHASIKTTQRYVNMDLSDLVEASRLDPRNMGGIRLVPHLQAGTQAREDASHRHAAAVASA